MQERIALKVAACNYLRKLRQNEREKMDENNEIYRDKFCDKDTFN
jgi:hypothetical protein